LLKTCIGIVNYEFKVNITIMPIGYYYCVGKNDPGINHSASHNSRVYIKYVILWIYDIGNTLWLLHYIIPCEQRCPIISIGRYILHSLFARQKNLLTRTIWPPHTHTLVYQIETDFSKLHSYTSQRLVNPGTTRSSVLQYIICQPGIQSNLNKLPIIVIFKTPLSKN